MAISPTDMLEAEHRVIAKVVSAAAVLADRREQWAEQLQEQLQEA